MAVVLEYDAITVVDMWGEETDACHICMHGLGNLWNYFYPEQSGIDPPSRLEVALVLVLVHKPKMKLC